MLRSLWLRLTSSSPTPGEERALARYFRVEGLHAELAAYEARDIGSRSGYERILHPDDLYFAP